MLTACLALVGNLFYVLVYTRWLKRSTPQNIVIGGAAGAVPPLVGYAAATGNLALPALFLFLIVFFWTPPHFWALALLIKRDYAAAKVPMLPVVRGDRETARQVLLYTVLLVALTLVPVLTGTFGWLYLVAAVVLGGQFIRLALRLRRVTAPAQAGRPLPLLPCLSGPVVRGHGDRPDGGSVTDLTEPVEQPPPSEPVPRPPIRSTRSPRMTRWRGRTRPSAGHCSDSPSCSSRAPGPSRSSTWPWPELSPLPGGGTHGPGANASRENRADECRKRTE